MIIDMIDAFFVLFAIGFSAGVGWQCSVPFIALYKRLNEKLVNFLFDLWEKKSK